MNDLPKHNLDFLAAKHAQALVQTAQNANVKPKDLENSLTKTLGVLQENGVYACFLYLLAREKENGNKVIQQMRELLKAMGIEDTSKDNLEYAQKITESLPILLLAKEALEQMLIYSRYGAKAAGKAQS
ncbi:MAG: hypothetical protein C4583_19240 [Anaerolineaceae bacterium]|jgi:hypothetical protein|nr:MAG: hypothetical protein C4583_19240 [Anaerolineaceae bacterium]